MIDKKYNIYELLYNISENNEDEQEAIRGYTKLLDILNNLQSDIMADKSEIIIKAIKDVKDYVSEEMKHSRGLSQLYSDLSGIIAEND